MLWLAIPTFDFAGNLRLSMYVQQFAVNNLQITLFCEIFSSVPWDNRTESLLLGQEIQDNLSRERNFKCFSTFCF